MKEGRKSIEKSVKYEIFKTSKEDFRNE